LYSAAYENVTYRDSTDDENEGEVIDGGPRKEFDLEAEGERLTRRLQFLATVARLWVFAARKEPAAGEEAPREAALAGWLATAQGNHRKLLTLLDAVHAHAIPEPSGSYESLVEYDRRRGIKERLLYAAIATALDTGLAVGALQGVLGQTEGPAGADRPPWAPLVVELEQVLLRGDAARARAAPPAFLEHLQPEPLLF